MAKIPRTDTKRIKLLNQPVQGSARAGVYNGGFICIEKVASDCALKAEVQQINTGRHAQFTILCSRLVFRLPSAAIRDRHEVSGVISKEDLPGACNTLFRVLEHLLPL